MSDAEFLDQLNDIKYSDAEIEKYDAEFDDDKIIEFKFTITRRIAAKNVRKELSPMFEEDEEPVLMIGTTDEYAKVFRGLTMIASHVGALAMSGFSIDTILTFTNKRLFISTLSHEYTQKEVKTYPYNEIEYVKTATPMKNGTEYLYIQLKNERKPTYMLYGNEADYLEIKEKLMKFPAAENINVSLNDKTLMKFLRKQDRKYLIFYYLLFIWLTYIVLKELMGF